MPKFRASVESPNEAPAKVRSAAATVGHGALGGLRDPDHGVRLRRRNQRREQRVAVAHDKQDAVDNRKSRLGDHKHKSAPGVLLQFVSNEPAGDCRDDALLHFQRRRPGPHYDRQQDADADRTDRDQDHHGDCIYDDGDSQSDHDDEHCHNDSHDQH